MPPSAGRVMVDGQDLAGLDQAAMRRMRRRMQLVFQDPYPSVDPRRRVGAKIGDGLQIYGLDQTGRVAALLDQVGLAPAHADRFPHDFSGGQRQRIAIARALITRPKLIVADEPVSALDVSVQAQVLNLLRDLQDELGLAYIFISHDLAVVRFMADEVLVMKDGEVVEQASVAQILDAPQQEYTRRLLGAIPRGYRAAQRHTPAP